MSAGANCPDCRQSMLHADGCTLHTLTLVGERYARRPYGTELDDVDWADNIDQADTCRDCGTNLGHVHHARCCVERCPRCGDQLLDCPCRRSARASPNQLARSKLIAPLHRRRP